VAVAVAGTIGGGGQPPTRSSSRVQQAAAATTTHISAPAQPKPATTQPAVTATTHSTVTATPAAATTPAPVADTLEARGHQLMVDGNYAAAIPVLRQALAAATPDSLTYGYALYDLGRSLRLAGDPVDAVRVLYQRLQIPNQTDTVRAQLQLALLALGEQASSGGVGAGPAAHGRHGHRGGDGGPNGGPPGGGPAGGVPPVGGPPGPPSGQGGDSQGG
jgi:hypothetical protein